MDYVMTVNFTSTDQRINFSVPYIKENTFAEIEEKLYQKFPEYRNTNNNFLHNGNTIFRFKTIVENNFSDGFPVILVLPDNEN